MAAISRRCTVYLPVIRVVTGVHGLYGAWTYLEYQAAGHWTPAMTTLTLAGVLAMWLVIAAIICATTETLRRRAMGRLLTGYYAGDAAPVRQQEP